jgi:WD40 repeat protein
LTGSLAAGLLAALALAGLAYWQREIAVEQRDLAESRRISALTEVATSERLSGELDTALRLGVHAARLSVATTIQGPAARASRTALAAAVWQSDWQLALAGNDGWVQTAVFSPDNNRVVTAADDHTVRIWDAHTGTQLLVLRGGDGYFYSAAFSPDGERVVTSSSDKTARIWDATSGAEIAVLRGHEEYVRSAAFSPDGAFVVTASADKTTRIWDATTGAEMAVLRGHEGIVTSAAFGPDGTRIVTGSYDRTARAYGTGQAAKN